eukprot:212086-Rhodomonas_salina.1
MKGEKAATRPVRVVEIEEIAVDVDAEEDSHVLVSRERGGQADDADHALRTLDLERRDAERSRYDEMGPENSRQTR